MVFLFRYQPPGQVVTRMASNEFPASLHHLGAYDDPTHVPEMKDQPGVYYTFESAGKLDENGIQPTLKATRWWEVKQVENEIVEGGSA